MLRSKGFFWLATRPLQAGQWSQAGGIAHYGLAGTFWRAIAQDNWPPDEETRAHIQAKWVEPFGDMRQELVFIGQHLQPAEITRLLDACLLNDDQMAAGVDYWLAMADPFPAW